MDWKVFVQQAILALGGMGVACGILAWLAKAVLTQWLAKDVEAYKEKLRHESAESISKLTSLLNAQALEHEVKYRRNDEKVAEALIDVYRALQHLYECVCRYVQVVEHSGAPSKEERLASLNEANKAFWNCFMALRLYIPRPLFKRTSDLARNLLTIVNKFTTNYSAEVGGHSIRDDDYWLKADKAVNDEAGPVFSAIIGEFQRRLGVFDPSDEVDDQDVSQRGTVAPPDADASG